MRPRSRRQQRSRDLAAATSTAADRLSSAEAALQAALDGYLTVRAGHGDARALRRAHADLTAGYQAATRAAAALERLAPGTMRTRLGELETALQVHLLEATASAIAVPTCVRVSSRAALGPRVAGLGFGFEDPFGPAGTRTIGVDMTGSAEVPPAEPAPITISAPTQRVPASTAAVAAA